MPTAEEDFESVLSRCRESLEGISLTVPGLEPPGAKRSPPSYFDDVVPAAPPPPARAPEPAPAPEAAPPPPARREPPAPPPEAAEPEIEVFPPPAFVPPPTPMRVKVTPLPEEAAGRVLRRWAPALAAAAALAAVGGGVAYFRAAAERPVEIPLSVKADAVAFDPASGDVLAASGLKLQRMTRDGRVLSEEALSEPAADVDYDDGSLWTLDGRSPVIVERRRGQRPQRFDLNHVPTWMVVHGRSIWTADRADGALRQYLVSRSILGTILQPLDRYDLPGVEIESFTLDDAGTLWVVNARTRRLIRYQFQDGAYKRMAAAPLSPILGPEGPLRALFVEPKALWIESSGVNGTVLRRLPLSSLDWSAAD